MTETSTRDIGQAVAATGWAAVAVAWAVLIAVEAAGWHQHLSHDELLSAGLPSPAAVLGFLAFWLLMVMAMMVPGRIRDVAAVAERHAGTGVSAVVGRILGTFLVAWAGFGLAALVGDLGIHRLVSGWEWLHDRDYLVGAAVLALAGTFQLSPAKRRALFALRRSCADLPGMHGDHDNLPHDHDDPPYERDLWVRRRTAWRTGVRHAATCVGCCWALMLLMFAVGGGGLGWMLGLTLVMIGEQTLPYPHWLAMSVGLVLVGAGVGVLIDPALVVV